jgi:two-component system sensor histidine kinase KdpD
MARGTLRIYLGAAPGVGKTFAMLEEGARRASRGTDVVVGVVETHGRRHTEARLEGLEVIPRRDVAYRGTVLKEMDLDAILERNPQVVLVDEMAHTNAPGSHNAKRWQDIEDLLDAGIHVLSTVNIQHLESMNDVVQQITGVEQREIVPDAVVRAAEQVHLVDQTPEALRRRLAHGNVYPAERIDAALDNYFRQGNLAALRELALMWVADQVDDGLQNYRVRHGITGPWDTRERILVAITGAPGGDHAIRRAARMAARSRGDLVAVHIRPADGLADNHGGRLAAQRELVGSLGGQYREVAAGDVAESLVRVANDVNATQIVLGASARSRWSELVRGSVINDVIRRSGDVDVHVITPPRRPGEDTAEPDKTAEPSGGGDVRGQSGVARRAAARRAAARRDARRRRSPHSRRRQLLGWFFAIVGPLLTTAVLHGIDPGSALNTDLLLFTLVVLLAAVVGGFWPALCSAVLSFLLANFYFTEPTGTFTIAEARHLSALAIFVIEGTVIGLIVERSTRRLHDAQTARADAETVAALAGSVVGETEPLPRLVAQLRTAFGAVATGLLVKDRDGWAVEAEANDSDAPVDLLTAELDTDLHLSPEVRLVIAGTGDQEVDPNVLDAFGSHLVAALEQRQLRRNAERASQLEHVNEFRAGLLAALSHDLRTPLAAVQASASALAHADVGSDPALRTELLDAILEHTGRLTVLITNLLEMSRIQADVVILSLRPVALDELIPAAIESIDTRGIAIDVRLDESLPRVLADAPLLERALANLIDNAVKWSPTDAPVRIDASRLTDRLALRVVDRGPGIPTDRRTDVLRPFQRVGDANAVEGIGLGLAVAHGFLSRMDAQLLIDDTPDGGTTMTVLLPIADEA